MDFLKTLMAYMAATLMVAVESTSTPSVTPEPTPGPEPTRIVATAEPTEEPTATPEPTVSVTPVPVPTITPNTRAYHNIASGARGAEVRRIQERLIELGYLPEGSADGVYGRQTANAVRRFQYYNGLTQDGIAGRTTQTNLFENPDAAHYPQEITTGTPEGTPAPQLTTEPPEAEAAPAPEETPAAEAAGEDQEKNAADASRGGTYEQRAAQRKAEEAAAAATPVAEAAEDVTPIPDGALAASPAGAESPAEAAQETPAATPEETPAMTPAETPEETPTAAPAETAGETSGETPAETVTEAPAEAPSDMPAENSAEAETPIPAEASEAPEPQPAEETTPAAEEPAEEMPGEDAATAGMPEAVDEVVEHVDLDAIEETAEPQPAAETERLEYEDLAGWIVLNGSGEALQWTEMSEGVAVARSPRMQRNGDDIRISLDDTARSLEGWELTDEGDSVVLVAEGYTLALLNEHAGFVAAVDGAEMTVDVNDFDFGEGHFIRASFLAEALDGEWKWDGEEETLALEIPGKNQTQGAD